MHRLLAIPVWIVLTLPAAADGPAVRALPGLVPAPAPRAGILQWQLIPKQPRSINCFDISPDGKVAALSDGAFIRICSEPGYKQLRVLAGHTDKVTNVAFSPDGKRLASTSLDRTARVWDLSSSAVTTLAGHDDAVTAADWFPDGKSLATTSRDGSCRIWTSDGQAGKTFKSSEAPLTCLAISPDGKRIAIGDEDRGLNLWDVASAKVIAHCEGHHGAVRSIHWNPDGKSFASGCSGYEPRDGKTQEGIASLRVWDADGKTLAAINDYRRGIGGVRWHPTEPIIAVSCEDKSVRFWSPKGENLGTYYRQGAGVMRWSPSGKTIIQASPEAITHVDAPEGKSIPSTQSIDLKRSNRKDVDLYVQRQTRWINVAWGSNPGMIAATAADASARLFDANGRFKHRLVPSQETNGTLRVAWRPGKPEVLLTGVFMPGAVIFGTDGKQLLKVDIGGRRLDFTAWLPDGKSFVASSSTLVMQMFPDNGIAKFDTLATHRDLITSLALSPDGKLVASGARNAALRIDGVDKKYSLALEGFSGAVDALDWTPDGAQLAAGADDGSWKLWQKDGQEGEQFPGHVDTIMALAFSPDGKRLATGGWDSTVRIWTLDGKNTTTFADHTAPVMGVAWSPDGKHILSSSRDSLLRSRSVDSGNSDWFVALMPDGATLTFSGTGVLLDGSAQTLDENMQYMVRYEDGRVDTLSHAQFANIPGAAAH